MDLKLRPGTPADAQRCGVICFEAFKTIAARHDFPPDFPSPDDAVELTTSVLSREAVYSVVAEVDGQVVGSNFLWETASIGGVGPISIDPAVQNGAVGRALMQDVLVRARRQRLAGVRLVQAAYHNRSMALYTKLGFAAREPLSTMQGAAIGIEIPGHVVRAAGEQDLDACNAVCMRVHGHTRGEELHEAIRQGTARLVEHDSRVSGFATSIGFFGHAVGESNEDLKALIGASPGFAGPGFMLPTRNGELLRWCLDHGLRVVQPMTLMSLGLYNEPAGPFLPSILY